MLDLIHAVFWLIAMAYFGTHVFWRYGGIFSSLTMILMFTTLYFSSTNVVGPDGTGGTIATQNPMAAWVAILLAIFSTLIFFMAVFGVWSPDERREDERGAGEYSLSDVLGGRL